MGEEKFFDWKTRRGGSLLKDVGIDGSVMLRTRYSSFLGIPLTLDIISKRNISVIYS
jgi:hypothetical protein